jgi:hypothetical protein
VPNTPPSRSLEKTLNKLFEHLASVQLQNQEMLKRLARLEANSQVGACRRVMPSLPEDITFPVVEVAHLHDLERKLSDADARSNMVSIYTSISIMAVENESPTELSMVVALKEALTDPDVVRAIAGAGTDQLKREIVDLRKQLVQRDLRI